MAASRCSLSPWATCKRIKLQHIHSIPFQAAAISTTTSLRRAQPIEEPTSLVEAPSTSANDSTKSTPTNGYLGENPRPLKRQDTIKQELLDIARARNIHIPEVLDPENEAKISRLPRSIQALYLAPMRRKPTHGYPVANLQLRSYSVRNLEFMADFALRAAYYLNLPAKGPVPLPRITERWTVPRSNFIFKKSQENWERVTTRRLVQIQDGHPEVVRRWLAFIRKHCWYGVGLKADVFEWEDTNVVKRLDEAAEKVGSADDMVRWDLFGKRKGATGKSDIEKMLDEKGFGSTSAAPAQGRSSRPQQQRA